MSVDPSPVPSWFTDANEPGPCPCGEQLTEDVLAMEGPYGMVRWFHPDCLDFLAYELDDDEIEELEEDDEESDEDQVQ